MMLATSTVTTSLNDIILWADTTWCFRAELGMYDYMSDDYTVIRDGSDAYFKFLLPEEEFLAREQDEPQSSDPVEDRWLGDSLSDALEAHLQSLPDKGGKWWDELYVATTGDTYLDRDPITGVVYYDHLGDQDVSDIPY